MLLTFLLLLLQNGERYVHPGPRFELVLPSAEWKPSDQGASGVLAMVFTPVKDMTTRCSVLRFGADFLPRGLETREQQMIQAAGQLYARVALAPGEIDGRAATRWEYTIAGATSVEWAFQESDGPWVVFQISGTRADWEDGERRAMLEALPGTFRWTGGHEPERGLVSRTPAAELRAQRTGEPATARAFTVDRHRIEVVIEPERHTLAASDRLTITAGRSAVSELQLYTSVVEVVEVSAARELAWDVTDLPNAHQLRVTLAAPLAAGESFELHVRTESPDFFLSADQELVAEIAVYGQVRPRSSWSSHVVWYPMDEHNDAAMDITFDVPAGFTAVTGGKRLESSERDGRARFRYVEEVRYPRALPFGFALGRYGSDRVERASGLTLHVYGFEGEETLVDQRIAALTECADAFERALGPLPWSDVHFAHVTPERKETGVSLPGLILVSDFYFPDLADVDASSGNLSDPRVLGLLVVADELSHQWNFYSAGFPNELAEGISTYTNALFLEEREGRGAYEGTIRYCVDAWLGGAGSNTEFALADPKVYSNARYRPVVFCKTPVVLDTLRRKLGDERFFDGFRRAFALRDTSIDGFERLEQGFEAAAGEELRPFFDQWFFRAGFPTLEVALETRGSETVVTLRQTQAEEPYVLDVELELTCADGSKVVETVTLREVEHVLTRTLASPATAVALGPEGRLPARLTKR